MKNDERLTSGELQELIGCYEGFNCDGWDCYTDCAFWNGKRCTFNDREDGE